jgi:hypothetical protein
MWLSPTNPRRGGRPPDPAVEKRRRSLIDLVDSLKPATVRQVFYAASVRGLVEKSEEGYGKVQNDLTLLRKGGRLPYGWLADSTRWQRKPRTFGSIQQALENTAKLYRRALWENANEYVEIWLEKDALAGVIYPVTGKYDVPLMVARGYASLSFLYSAAEFIAELDKPAVIYHLGDYDPSGQDAARAIEQTLRELAPEATIRFKRLAVTPAQIEAWSLPSRPTKKDRHASRQVRFRHVRRAGRDTAGRFAGAPRGRDQRPPAARSAWRDAGRGTERTFCAARHCRRPANRPSR